MRIIRIRDSISNIGYEATIIANDDEAASIEEELTKLVESLEYSIIVEEPQPFKSVKEDLELAVSELVETGVLEECPSCHKMKATVERQYSYGIYAGKMCRTCAINRFNDSCGHTQPMGNVRELDDCGTDD